MARHHAKHLWGFVQTSSGYRKDGRRFRSRVFAAMICIALLGCAPPPKAPTLVTGGRPHRVVSLDYCADQFVLKLADRNDIAALSPDATGSFSYMRSQARGLPTVRPSAEDVLALKPDLIVRSYGGDPRAVSFFERAGIKVHQIGWGEDFAAIRTNVSEAAQALAQTGRGEAIITDFDARLAKLRPAPGISTLYVTSGGITTGTGSMIDRMMTQAGLRNFQSTAGWNPLPLETLVRTKPRMIATAFFDNNALARDYWSSARHPIIKAALADLPVAALDGATTSCGGWFVMDAMEVLARRGLEVSAHDAR
jgi:iron complex transport system substrate-binding protein